MGFSRVSVHLLYPKHKQKVLFSITSMWWCFLRATQAAARSEEEEKGSTLHTQSSIYAANNWFVAKTA